MTRGRQIGLAVLMLLAVASVLLVAASALAQTFPTLSGRVAPSTVT